jgi:hypothetical protein
LAKLFKVVKKLVKNLENLEFCEIVKSTDIVATAEKSETVRGRRRGGRRFVVPRPGATLSHRVKSEIKL